MTEFSEQILNWYISEQRKLPWRGSADPYIVWVSEIMLQQTRVESVIPYFERWMERFPNIASLAAASEQQVLSVWEGLGYYGRARNLHKAAKIVMKEYGGELPRETEALRKLPGIGRYSVGAIASIAFGQDVATLDANLRRVFARVFDMEQAADSTAGEEILWGLAEQHLPKGRTGDYNQALMDLGAMICLPRNPRCLLCPLRDLCQARRLGIQSQRPVLKPKAVVPHFTVTAAVVRRNGKVLLAKRPSKGLLGGMWEFPGGKMEKDESFEACLRREIQEELGVGIGVGESFGVYQHAYTHFRITLHAFLCQLTDGEPKPIEAAELAWIRPDDLAHYPMGKVDRQIARKLVSCEEIL
ncbi:MAG: A/G-specific adenine glycosylase [Anaerolineales bacterium]|jgi:A/G-specific adenine glycosylase